jgi:hypothetical protein
VVNFPRVSFKAGSALGGTDGGKNQVGVLDVVKKGNVHIHEKAVRCLNVRRPVFPRRPCGGFGRVGQLQHLDVLGKPVYLLQPEGQNKSQARLIDLFLNAAVYADSGHLDPVLIGPNVNEKEVIANKYQHDPGDEDLHCAPQPEVQPGKFEPLDQFIYV